MAQYIPKSAVLAEIERRVAENKKDIERASHKNLEDYFEGYEDALVLFKEKFLDALEVKDVNLEEEFNDFLDNVEGVPPMWHSDEQIEWAKDIARHFFELGLKARKEEVK